MRSSGSAWTKACRTTRCRSSPSWTAGSPSEPAARRDRAARTSHFEPPGNGLIGPWPRRHRSWRLAFPPHVARTRPRRKEDPMERTWSYGADGRPQWIVVAVVAAVVGLALPRLHGALEPTTGAP